MTKPGWKSEADLAAIEAAARADEREKVAAYLRRVSCGWQGYSGGLGAVADEIERGVHERGEKATP